MPSCKTEMVQSYPTVPILIGKMFVVKTKHFIQGPHKSCRVLRSFPHVSALGNSDDLAVSFGMRVDNALTGWHGERGVQGVYHGMHGLHHVHTQEVSLEKQVAHHNPIVLHGSHVGERGGPGHTHPLPMGDHRRGSRQMSATQHLPSLQRTSSGSLTTVAHRATAGHHRLIQDMRGKPPGTPIWRSNSHQFTSFRIDTPSSLKARRPARGFAAATPKAEASVTHHTL